MPHKKNPDVFELVRGRCNDLQALPHAIALATSNLPSGYHRDLQLIKEKFFPAFGQIMDCLRMVRLMFSHIEVKEGLLEDEKYKYLFSVEEVNQLVLQGIPFRDAYGRVGQSIERGEFKPTGKIHHTHEGSMGNLCNDEISKMMDKEIQSFQFDVANGKVAQLLS